MTTEQKVEGIRVAAFLFQEAVAALVPEAQAREHGDRMLNEAMLAYQRAAAEDARPPRVILPSAN